jgi:hypothetical protein
MVLFYWMPAQGCRPPKKSGRPFINAQGTGEITALANYPMICWKKLTQQICGRSFRFFEANKKIETSAKSRFY